jgi:hypothetical protein
MKDNFIHQLYLKHYAGKAKRQPREVCIRCGARAILGTKRPWLGLCKKCRKLEWKAVLVVLLLICSPVSWGAVSDADGVRCVMGEARNQPYSCQVATAEALRNRGNTKGVYGCKAPVNEPQRVWDKARRAWAESASTNLVKGAKHWESTDFKRPSWSKSMVVTATYGKHEFFK